MLDSTWKPWNNYLANVGQLSEAMNWWACWGPSRIFVANVLFPTEIMAWFLTEIACGEIKMTVILTSKGKLNAISWPCLMWIDPLSIDNYFVYIIFLRCLYMTQWFAYQIQTHSSPSDQCTRSNQITSCSTFPFVVSIPVLFACFRLLLRPSSR